MRLLVENLPANGRTVTFELADEWARDAAAVALDGAPVALSGGVELSAPTGKGRVLVTATVAARVDRVCDRCAEPVVLEVAGAMSLLYLPSGEPVEENADAIPEQDLDVGWYPGGELDLAQVLSESIALQLPPRVTCEGVEACDGRTEALFAAHRATLPPPTGGFSVLQSHGASRPSK